ncbi:MAG: hypothetical protein CMO01_13275 [Thalassobius sp.]|nr:hypothetical protein [Thalassovita sp.]
MTINIEQAKKIFFQHFNKNEIDILKFEDFEWGIIFYWNSKDYVEKGTNLISNNTPVLIDKIDQSFHFINDLENFATLDQQLENYRVIKGYAHTIKFPPKADLSNMSDIEKALYLMRSREFIQIQQAIEIINEKKLFNLNSFLKLLYPKYDNVLETIANNILNLKGEYILNNIALKAIPSEINIFKNDITGIYIHDCKIEELPNEITDLHNLKYILVELSPLKKIPFDLRKLRELESVNLVLTNISDSDISKFLLPKNCKIEIKGKYPQ